MITLINEEQQMAAVARVFNGRPVCEVFDLEADKLVGVREFSTIEKAEAYAHAVHRGLPLAGDTVEV